MTVAELVELYRSLPGVEATKKDGGVIAGQVGRFGDALVELVIREGGYMIGAATHPLQYFVKLCEGRQSQAPRVVPSTAEVPKVRPAPLPDLTPEQVAANRERYSEMIRQVVRTKGLPPS